MAQVNYVPNPATADPSPGGMKCVGGSCAGYGPPSDTSGFNGYTYVDLSSGDLYVKYGDIWVIQAAGTGAGLTYHQGAFLDPNGNVTGSIGDVYHSRVASGGDGSTWWKVSGTNSNTVWE